MPGTTQTWDGVGWLGDSSVSVQDLNLQALQHRPVLPVPDQEGAVSSVQRWRDVDADVLLLVQWTYLHFKCVSTWRAQGQFIDQTWGASFLVVFKLFWLKEPHMTSYTTVFVSWPKICILGSAVWKWATGLYATRDHYDIKILFDTNKPLLSYVKLRNGTSVC